MPNNTQDTGSLTTGRWNGTVAVHIGAYMQFKFFLYGFYALLFSFLSYIVLSHRRLSTLFVAAAAVMFVIATADVIVTITYLFRDGLVGKLSADPPTKYVLFVTNNAFADIVLFYRFHLTVCLGWKTRGIILSFTCAFLALSTACGYFYAQSPTAKSYRLYTTYMWMTFALNAALSLITVSRNIYLVRTARSVLGSDIVRRYPATISTLLDSGIVYSLYLLIDLIAQSLVLDAGLNQIVGIVPTLLIIRLSIPGRARQDSIDTSGTPVLDSIPSIGELESELPLDISQDAVGIQMDARTAGQTEHA